MSAKPQPFKLQTVLDYRSEQLDAAQQALATEENKKQQLTQQLQQYDTMITETLNTQSQSLANGELPLEKLQAFPNYLIRLKQDRSQIYHQLLAHEQQLLQAREKLKHAHIQQKSFQILKDKHQQRVEQAQHKADETLMNDIALNRSSRKKA
jgi:flagellar export protein FliJ